MRQQPEISTRTIFLAFCSYTIQDGILRQYKHKCQGAYFNWMLGCLLHWWLEVGRKSRGRKADNWVVRCNEQVFMEIWPGHQHINDFNMYPVFFNAHSEFRPWFNASTKRIQDPHWNYIIMVSLEGCLALMAQWDFFQLQQGCPRAWYIQCVQCDMAENRAGFEVLQPGDVGHTHVHVVLILSHAFILFLLPVPPVVKVYCHPTGLQGNNCKIMAIISIL